MDALKISKRLIELRKSKELTQLELSEQINYSDKVISKWERGESLPSIEAFKILSDFYGLSIDDLISDKNDSASVVKTKRLETVQTKGPSQLLKHSIYLPLVFLLFETGQAIWANPRMLWVISILVFIIYLVVYTVICSYVTYESEYNGHLIKFVNKPSSAILYIDGVIVDEDKNLLSLGSTLTGKIENKGIKAKISLNLLIKCAMFVE